MMVVKQLNKERMDRSYLHELAQNEFAIHYSLSNFTKCNNIVKAPEYFEDEKAYYMIMEYSCMPTYFEDLLENVIIFNNYIRDTPQYLRKIR